MSSGPSAVDRAAPASAPPGTAIVAEHLAKRYGERVVALRDASFSIAPGEFVLLSGRSGSGKSTVLNLIAGLDRPDGGRVLVGGVDPAALDDVARYRREVIGFVFQLHHLLPGLTAQENVEVALLPTAADRAARRERARAALDEVGLQDRYTHLPGQLSGGERQRVAIARAIVGRPRVLLADEPTAALDSAASRHTLDLLSMLARTHGMTVLLVSYEPEAAVHADRVLQLEDGVVVAGGAPAVTPAPPPDAGA